MNTYFGNVLPYLASYYQAKRTEIAWVVDPLWIISVFNIIAPLSMVISGLMERWLGMQKTIFLGGLLACLSICSSYVAIREPSALVFTYGFVNAVGTGLLYSLCHKVVFQTVSSKKGLASGVMAAFQSVGSLINIGLAFAVVNPGNKKPDETIGNTNYFSDEGLISRVPYYFIAIGLLTVISSVTGFLLLVQFSANDYECQNEQRGEKLALKYVEESKTEFMSQKKVGEHSSENEPLTHKIIGSQQSSYNVGEPLPTCCRSSVAIFNDSTKDTNHTSNNEDFREIHEKNTVCVSQSDHDKNNCFSDLTPWEALKAPRFWIVWLISLFLAHTFYVLTNLFKQYGLLKITNDQILMITGLLSTITLIATRPSAGIFSDRFGVKMTMVMTCAMSSIFMCLMVVTLHLSPALYIISTVVGFSCSSTYFIVSSLVVNELIGPTHYPSIIGLVYTARIVSSFMEPVLVSAMVVAIGWDWIFLSGAASALLALVISLALPETGCV